LQEAIANLEPEHNKYLQTLPLTLKIDEYAQECRQLQDSISSINSTLNDDIRMTVEDFMSRCLIRHYLNWKSLEKAQAVWQKPLRERTGTWKS
jgi:hypothetical protein